MNQKNESAERLVASNKKALHDYHVLDRMEVGIVLEGTEVKSLREGAANLRDSYVLIRDGEAFLLNAHISPYGFGNRENHEPMRTRKLLMHKREIEKLAQRIAEKGLSVVPLRLYFRGPKIKAEIAVVKGKKLFDKRETEKKKEAVREAAAAIKNASR